MEEGEIGEKPGEEELPPPDELKDMKVKVIKPFKPSPRVSRIVRQGKCYYHPIKPASYICSSCGKSVCSVCAKNLGDVFFCPQCAPLEAPIPPPSAPREAETAVSWYRALFTIGVILVIIGLLFVLLYWPLTSMSAAKFENLQEEYWDEGGHNFKGYRSGDIIVIRDKIVRRSMEYDPIYGVVTRLWFDSTGKDDNDFNMLFDADLERDYKVGDTVSITLHVDEDDRTHDEVIQELNNDLPDMSNIDHTLSIDLVFYAIIIFGIFLILIYGLFTHKIRRAKTAESLASVETRGEEGKLEGEGSAK